MNPISSHKAILLLLVLILIVAVAGIGSWFWNKKSLTKFDNKSAEVQTLIKENFASENQTQPTIKVEDAKTALGKAIADAVETDTVNISGCEPDPASAKIKLNSVVTLKNSDESGHKLTSGDYFSVDVPARSSIKVNLNFPDSGVYLYSCDGNIAGVFQLVP